MAGAGSVGAGRAALIALVIVVLSGCFGTEVTPFPEGLEPLEEEILTDWPQPEDEHPEMLSSCRHEVIQRAIRANSVHARGFVQAPIQEVWTAFRSPDVNADRRVFASYSMEESPDDSGRYDYVYLIHARVEDIINIEYDVEWRHGVIEGTLEEPELVSIRYQKTDGSTALQLLQGWVLLTALSDDVTAVEIVEHLAAPTTDHATIERFLGDMFFEVVELAHGRGLPDVSALP